MQKNDEKSKLLAKQGTLNARAVKVIDPLFLENDFFDPRDLVQVKYEMLRRVEKDGQSTIKTAESFGFSRAAFYQVKAAFDAKGLSGLLPQKRGPRGRHKLKTEIMDHIYSEYEENPSIEISELLDTIKNRFDVKVHRRTLERALSENKKKRKKSK